MASEVSRRRFLGTAGVAVAASGATTAAQGAASGDGKAVKIIAIATSFPARAHELSVSDVNDLPVSQVATYHSMAGEGLSAFIKRIAPEFASYTERTGHEACAMVAVTKKENDGTVDGAFSVMMGSIGSQISLLQ